MPKSAVSGAHLPQRCIPHEQFPFIPILTPPDDEARLLTFGDFAITE
jgi:hypothetical protein